MAGLKIGSFNCKNFNNIYTMDFIQNTFKDCDFLLLQEHWLYKSQFHLFDNVFGSDVNVSYCGKSSMDDSIIRIGRPFGGNIIIWKNTIKNKIVSIDTVSNRLTCIKLFIDDENTMLLFNVYMPCDTGRKDECFIEFQNILVEIQSLLSSHAPTCFIIGGDMNADFNRKLSPNVKELNVFCADEEAIPCFLLPVSTVKYSYECSVSLTGTLIDHFVIGKNLTDNIVSYSTVDSVDSVSDHLGLLLEVDIACDSVEIMKREFTPKVAWYKASLADIASYKTKLDIELSKVAIPSDCVNCKDFKCNQSNHLKQIEMFHDNIVNSCITAAACLPHTKDINMKHSGSLKRTPGWNEHCAVKREQAIYYHNLWKTSGRPKHGHLAETRRITRAQFHHAVRLVQRNEGLIKSQNMAESILQNDTRNLFKEAKKMRGSSTRIPGVIDGVTGNQQIADVFSNKFQKVFTSVPSCESSLDILHRDIAARINATCVNEANRCLMELSELNDMVRGLKLGKADGNLGLFSDHIINGSELLYTYITFLFNAMIVHGYSPADMLIGTMVPIPKGRSGLSSSDNFRGICLQSVLCKLFDLFILQREKAALITSDLQFGFKEKVSATLATALVTETVDYFKYNGGPVYGLALDASKAFDRVEYYKLFHLLIERGCNIFFVRLLLNMYMNQRIRVKFNSCISNLFSVTNGVKQGGILSPTLFTCYVDGLIQSLRKAGLGCTVGNTYVGCICYADDIMLLAPNLCALRGMISICERFANDHSIIFNGNKSKLIVFNSRHHHVKPNVEVNGESVDVVDSLKYLGHFLFSDRSNPMTEHVRKDFVRRANACIADFKNISSPVLHDLIEKYCYSFYGINLCSFDDPSSCAIFVEWRKIMRRIWRLPTRAHCCLIPHIARAVPPDIVLYQRYVNFFYAGLCSDNSTISSIFQMSVNTPSRMGNNIRFVFEKAGSYFRDVNSISSGVIRKNVLNKWSESLCESDILKANQIRELILERDDIDTWIFNYEECQHIINVLCTE